MEESAYKHSNPVFSYMYNIYCTSTNWQNISTYLHPQITEAVHRNKSFIYLQLWALGRAAQPRQLAKEPSSTGQDLPFVGPSPLRLSTSPASDPTPRALTLEEISEYIELYAQAAENAVLKAGFDGVELHGANGYLVDQFLQDVSNTRTDKYGGSVENRTRFGLDVLDAIVKRIGPRKVGLRMSPWSVFQGDFKIILFCFKRRTLN